MKRKYTTLLFQCPKCDTNIRILAWNRDLKQLMQGKRETIPIERKAYG